VFVGGVMTVQAKNFYVKLSNAGWWENLNAITAISTDDGATKTDMTTVYMYGDKWAYIVLNDNVTSAKIYRHCWENQTEQYYNETSVTINSTGDTYVNMSDGTVTETTQPTWNYLTCRNNIKNTWNEENANTTRVDGNTFTYELSKTEIGSNTYIIFRLRNGDKVMYNDAGQYINGWPQIYPNTATDNNCNLEIASSTTEYYHNTDATDWVWHIDIPTTYDYEKVVITAKYINDGGYKWQISADAYISKTLAFVENTYIGTFGSAANVDFSKVEGLTAKKLKVSAGTIVETNATTLFGGEGALLTAESAGPFSIPVAASASADADNYLVAIPAKVKLDQEPEDGYIAYVLTNKIADGTTDGTTGPLAFYKVNSNGTWCAAGTAYLKVAQVAVPGAPDFIPFGETTGIENVSHEAVTNNQYYTLDGRRVAQPTKGLYIVNGKKVIIK
jgi:hypothetical protein